MQATWNRTLSGDGVFTERSHKWLEERLGARKALLTHSGTGALEMSAILLDIMPGDEVIMPSYTFVSTANAFVLRGATPVFVDIRRDTLNIDEAKIEQAITSKTKAIVVVHYAGVACEMDAIMHLARKHNVFVVEDAAQAIFSTYKKRNLGTIGDIGCLSFHATKNIVSGEGGALLINNTRFVERAEIVREKGTNRARFLRGQVDKYTWEDIGSSFLPSDLLAALLYGQLRRSNRIQKQRKKAWDFYRKSLADGESKGWFEIERKANYEHEHNYHMFYLLLNSPQERTDLIEHLRQKGIYSVFHYVPLHSSPAGLMYGRVSGDLSVTDEVSKRLIRLPLYSGVRGRASRVVKEVARYFRSVQ
jgi:dTDP-4-amino-4,6-dideoxygalactose transaminase